MPRGYYMPTTRAQQPGTVAVREQQPAAPQEPVAPRRRLPMLDESAEVTAARAALLAAVRKALPPCPAEGDPTTVKPRARTGRLRSVTLDAKRLSKRALDQGRLLYPIEEHEWAEGRPRSYELCEAIGLGSVIPCPFVSCRSHLYLDVDRQSGNIRISRPDLDPTDLPETCGRRVSAKGGITLEALGAATNITRERVRQIETIAFNELRRSRRVQRAAHDLDP
jgi:hypothetical protein